MKHFLLSVVILGSLALPVGHTQESYTCPDGVTKYYNQSDFKTACRGTTAGGSISGDSLCGSSSSTKCSAVHLKQIGVKLFTLFVYFGSALLAVFIAGNIIYYLWAYMIKSDAGAITKAKEMIINSLLGFLIVTLVFGGFYLVVLKAFGVQPEVTKLLQLFSGSFIEHAHAQERFLPNPLSSNNAYEILMSAISLFLRFFVYPALIALWVAAGLKFVTSQGNPEGLTKARGWLMWAFIATIIIFSLQAFILALRATADRITGQAVIVEQRTEV